MTNGATNGDREKRLQEVLLGYLRGIDAGAPPDREELLRRHPDLADDLRTFFADQDRFDRLAAPLKRERQPAGLGRVPYFGDYELLEAVARGGMGVVYKARQNSLQRVVALKMMMTAGALATPEELERFRKESTEAAGLDHPNIVPVYEVGNHEGQAYFTMKYFPDGNLAAHLPELRKNPQEAARILASVARAVDHAHRHGVLHRDLKPANILLSFSREPPASAAGLPAPLTGGSRLNECIPHVADFGLAKRVAGDSGVTQSGMIVGTPSYMSPEQAAGKGARLSPVSDVYALGAILYECLTGRPPFRAESPLGTLMQVISEEPVPPRKLNPKADRILEAICLKCLEKDPARRYTAAAWLAQDLERWCRGEPVSVRRGWWSGRRRSGGRIAVVAALLIGLGLVVCCGLTSLTFTGYAAAERDRAVAAREQAMVAELLAREQEARAEAQRRNEQMLYAQRIALAQREWEDNNARQALELLDKARAPEPRGWEWHYLHRQLRGNVFKLQDAPAVKDDEVRDTVFTPDGSQVALVHASGRLRYWDSTSGKLIRDEPPGKAPVTGLAFSSDGKRVALGDRGGRVTIRDRAGAVHVAFRAHRNRVTRVAFSPDGKYLATAGDEDEGGSARLWDAATGDQVAALNPGKTGVRDLAFSPDNRFVATAGADLALRVWSLLDGHQVFSFSDRGNVAVAWQPDAQALAAAENVPQVAFWNASRWRAEPRLLQLGGPAVAMAFAPGTTRLAMLAWRDDVIKLWDSESQTELLTLGTGARFLTFSPDGRLLASGTKDGGVQFWDATPEEQKPGKMRKAD